MNFHNTVTLIVSKNYGRPLSWSLPVWGVYLGGALAAFLLVCLCVLSALYLVTYPRLLQVERELDEVRKERVLLQDQIISANQRAFEEKERALAKAVESRAGERAAILPSAHYTDDLYEPPIGVTTATARVNQRTVEVAFRLINHGDAVNNRGGLLFAIFENEDVTPSRFVTSPTVNTNAQGFPQTYKSGVRITRIRQGVTFRQRVRRASGQEYFTHVTLYLFSVRGGLILKERFEMDRTLFHAEQNKIASKPLTRA